MGYGTGAGERHRGMVGVPAVSLLGSDKYGRFDNLGWINSTPPLASGGIVTNNTSPVASGYPSGSQYGGVVDLPVGAITSMETSTDSGWGVKVHLEISGPEAQGFLQRVYGAQRGDKPSEDPSVAEIRALKAEKSRLSTDLEITKGLLAEERERKLSWKQTAEDLEGELNSLNPNKD